MGQGTRVYRLTWCHFLGQAGVWVAPASLLWLRCFPGPWHRIHHGEWRSGSFGSGGPRLFPAGRGSSLMIPPGDARFGLYSWAGDCPGGQDSRPNTRHLVPTIARLHTHRTNPACIVPPSQKREESSRISCCPTLSSAWWLPLLILCSGGSGDLTLKCNRAIWTTGIFGGPVGSLDS